MQNKGGLKHKFEGFGAQPSEKLWDSIASNLDQKKKKRALMFWWLGSAFSIGILVFFGVTYFSGLSNFKMSNPIVKNSTFAYKQNTIKSNTYNQKTSTKPTDLSDSNSSSNNLTESNFAIDQKSIDNQIINNQYNSSKISVIKSTNTIPNLQSTQLDTPVLNDITSVEIEQEESSSITKEKIEIQKLKIPLWSESPSIMYSQLGSSQIEMPPSKLNWIYSFNIQTQQGFKFPNKLYNTPNESVVAINNQDLFSQDPIQKRPLTLRFGIAKQFKKRLSFQTGIDLGWIQTNGYASKSTVFTLGIPVKLNLTMIERKRGIFYSNFGLVNDIPLFEMTRNFNGYKYEIASSKMITGFLGGTELGLGFNYKLNERLKFDVNSGFKWYYYQSAKTYNSINSQNAFLTFNAGLIWNY